MSLLRYLISRPGGNTPLWTTRTASTSTCTQSMPPSAEPYWTSYSTTSGRQSPWFTRMQLVSDLNKQREGSPATTSFSDQGATIEEQTEVKRKFSNDSESWSWETSFSSSWIPPSLQFDFNRQLLWFKRTHVVNDLTWTVRQDVMDVAGRTRNIWALDVG